MDDKGVVSMRKPVMLMVGEFRAGSTERGLVEGFRRLGWAVQEVDRGRYSAGVSRALLLRIASRLSMNAVVRAFQQAVLCECAVLRPDVLLAVKGTDLTGAMLEQISEAGARTVMYYPDVAFNHRGVDEASFRGYDCVLLEDCCATTSPAFCAEATLYNIRQCFGFVASSAALIEGMDRA